MNQYTLDESEANLRYKSKQTTYIVLRSADNYLRLVDKAFFYFRINIDHVFSTALLSRRIEIACRGP